MVLKRVFPTVSIALLLLLGGCVRQARAQFIGFTSPQSDQELAFNAATCAPATFTVHNIGQTQHFLSYTLSPVITNLDIRLEGSNDGVRFFAISEDGTDLSNGLVYAAGYFPVVRVNLVACNGSGTITASYVGTSAAPAPPVGSYNSSQALRKVIFTGQSEGGTTSVIINTPFGSSGGYIFIAQVSGAGGFPAGSSIDTVTPIVGNQNGPISAAISPTLNLGGLTSAVLAVSSEPTSQLNIHYTSGGASTNTFSAWYVFTNLSSPSGISLPQAQPLATLNSETTATAAAATKTIAASAGQRVLLFSLTAACSAGTATITIQDGSTTIWSHAGVAAGTTALDEHWNPGLASTVGNGMTITLGSCGVGNTGTLDVQASQQ